MTEIDTYSNVDGAVPNSTGSFNPLITISSIDETR